MRRLPKGRAYLVWAGLEQSIGDLLRLRFSAEQIEALRGWPQFAGVDPAFFERLATLRFEGDVWAVPEGTVVFPGEPLIRVEAPLPQAQWIESVSVGVARLSHARGQQSRAVVVGSEGASRFRLRPAPRHAGRMPDYSPRGRRTSRGAQGLATSRRRFASAYRVRAPWPTPGFNRSSMRATPSRPIPGHSRARRRCWSTPTKRLKASAAPPAIEPPIQAIRLDSGDLLELSVKARAILDSTNRRDVRIVASGDLDEYAVERLVRAGAPIDVFGVGTEMTTSRDAPALSTGLQTRRARRGRADQAQSRQEDVSARQAGLPD